MEKWLYYGILEDPYQEFFVEAIRGDKQKNKFEENYWDDSFAINKALVPSFLEAIHAKIFLSGKYINVIKAYDPNRRYEDSSVLVDTYALSLYNDDLIRKIESTFEWANE